MRIRRGRAGRCRGCGARIDAAGDPRARHRMFCSDCSAGAAESVARALAEDLPAIVVEVLEERPPYDPPIMTPVGNLHDLLASTCAGDHVADEDDA